MTKGELNQDLVNKSYKNILRKLNNQRSEKSFDQKVSQLKPNNEVIIKHTKMIKSPESHDVSPKKMHKTLD